MKNSLKWSAAAMATIAAVAITAALAVQAAADTSRGAKDGAMAEATFAAGCFWGVEDAFRNVQGVKDVTSGYTGGHKEDPTYKEVCSDTTGHAEAVLVEYNPQVVTYEDLLEVFWGIHDPTTMNRQGPDVGSQYRSAIFYHNAEQQAAAEASKKKREAESLHKRPIVTEITQATTFYPAEEYHQRYYEKHGMKGCHI
jgi:peptide-methionine (S)-S-oxide reductase